MVDLVPMGTTLLMHGVPLQLQYMFKLLLCSLAPNKHFYYQGKVRALVQALCIYIYIYICLRFVAGCFQAGVHLN